VKLTFAIEPPTLLDTAGAIGFAARAANITETFVAVNGDVLSDINVAQLLELHRARGAEATIALTPVEDPSAFGVVPTDADGLVQAFIEKPKREEAPTNFINAGTYILEPSVLDLIPEGERVSIERVVFPALAAKKTLYAMQSHDYFLDTGTPEKYVQANVDYLRGMRPTPPLPDAELRESNWLCGESSIAGTVSESLIGAGVGIGDGAVVERCVLANGAQIESGAIVRDSIVMANAVVGANSIVDHSVIGETAKVLSGAEIRGFSVIGFGAQVSGDDRLEGAKIEA
jgi:mannose-1-phosphate guanylyltransferase